LVFGPPDNKKLELNKEDAKEIYSFIAEGGNAIFIIPPNEEDLKSFKNSRILELFEIEPQIISRKVLLHKTNHIVNIDENYYQNNKKAIDKYVHFLTNYKHFDSEEILLEFEYEPVFYVYREGRGNAVFFGLDVDEFKKENVNNLIKYLSGDYSFYWEEINYDTELFKTIYEKADNKKQLMKDFIDHFLEHKSFRNILNVKDEDLKTRLLNSIDDEFLMKSFDELTPIQIEKQYRTIFRTLKKKKYNKFIKVAQKYLIKRIGKNKDIPQQIFNRLYDADILPDEASSLIIFYMKPKTDEEIDIFLKNLKSLREWNEYIGILEEQELKKMAKKFKK
jgi:hypothetical protein